MASSALATNCAARARFVASVVLASSNSALARMMPNWLFSRWNSMRRSGDSSIGPCETLSDRQRQIAWETASAARSPALRLALRATLSNVDGSRRIPPNLDLGRSRLFLIPGGRGRPVGPVRIAPERIHEDAD